MSQPPWTIGQIARLHGLSAWKVRRIFERGLLPPAARVGAYRVVPESDLPRVEQALRAAGYLPTGAGEVTPCR